MKMPMTDIRKILHIEDNETNFRLIERILEDRANLSLSWACNGQEGLALALQQRPALILLDLNLPDMHGSQLLSEFKNNTLTRDIPVIVLSADISPTHDCRVSDNEMLPCAISGASEPAIGPVIEPLRASKSGCSDWSSEALRRVCRCYRLFAGA